MKQLEYWQPAQVGLTLCATTGVAAVDQIIRGVIGLVELAFPARVRGYYIQGGYADGSAVRFQRGTLLVYGEDIRDAIPLKPLDSYVRDTMHGVYPLSARVRGNPAMLHFPLDYPDPEDIFYGYTKRQMRTIDGTLIQGTKDLVATTTMIASALVGLLAGQYTVAKQDSVAQYRRWVNDEWTALLEDSMHYCRGQWGYRVPDQAEDQARLRTLCARSLAFENYFYERYRPYLISELRHAELGPVRAAARRLSRLRYADAEVQAALSEAAGRYPIELA